MTPTPQAFLRTGALVLLVLVLQISGFSQLQFMGGNFDLIPLLVAAVALYAGALPGAVTGFSIGLLVDLAIGQDLGATSLVLTAVGYGVGRYGELREPAHGLIPLPVAAAATLGFLTAFAVVSFMLEIQATVSALVLRDALITTLLNVAIALPFFGLVRRVLRPVLLVDLTARRSRRREPRETGPLGLRGLEIR